MYGSFIFRGALGFVLGGIAFTQVPFQFAGLQGAAWIWLTLACGALGLVSAYTLQSLNEDCGKIKLWSSVGWIAAGVVFILVIQLLGQNARSGSSIWIVPAALAGLCAGLGLGMGWGGGRAARVLGVASAILLPMSMWVDMQVYGRVVLWLIQTSPGLLMSTFWLKVVLYGFVLSGFTIYGGFIGGILCWYSNKYGGENMITYSDYEDSQPRYRSAREEYENSDPSPTPSSPSNKPVIGSGTWKQGW